MVCKIFFIKSLKIDTKLPEFLSKILVSALINYTFVADIFYITRFSRRFRNEKKKNWINGFI